MLIVGGIAALTAIAVYLAWHFLRQWRLTTQQRAAGQRHPAQRSGAERELVPWE